MQSSYDDEPMLRYIDLLSGDAALKVHFKQTLIAVLEECRHLHEENDRLKKIVDLVDLKNERDELKAKLTKAEDELNWRDQCALGNPQ